MFSFLKQLLKFARVNQKIWMIPLVLLLLTVGGLIVVVQASSIAPLLYALF